jgi:hypothetical protein
MMSVTWRHSAFGLAGAAFGNRRAPIPLLRLAAAQPGESR